MTGLARPSCARVPSQWLASAKHFDSGGSKLGAARCAQRKRGSELGFSDRHGHPLPPREGIAKRGTHLPAPALPSTSQHVAGFALRSEPRRGERLTESRPKRCREAAAERAGFEPAVPLRVHMISNHAPSTTRSPLHGFTMAERVGFEPTVPLRAHLISNQAPSTTRSSLRGGTWQRVSTLSTARVRSQRGA